MTDIESQMTADHEARAESAAETAWERLKRGASWDDWKAISRRLSDGRTASMAKAGCNQPVGKTYNKAFSDWLDARKWAREIDKATRNQAMWCAENEAAIEAWRETVGVSQRLMMNHPGTIKRNFERMMVDRDKEKKEPTETKAQKVERELEALAAERDKWKRQAEKDGSLFDLKNDGVKIIAETIAQNMTDWRFGELVKAIVAEQTRRKAIKKQPKQAG
jgi:hypothetical protein